MFTKLLQVVFIAEVMVICHAAHSNEAPNPITTEHDKIRAETQAMGYKGYQGSPYQDGLYDTQNQGISDKVYAGVHHTKYTKPRPVGNNNAQKEDKLQPAASNNNPAYLHRGEAHGVDAEGQYVNGNFEIQMDISPKIVKSLPGF